MDKSRGGEVERPSGVASSPIRRKPPTSCGNRHGAPGIGPATRIGEKRAHSPCWGQSSLCVLRAREEMVLRQEAHARAATSTSSGRSGGHGALGTGRGTAAVPPTLQGQGQGGARMLGHWPNPGAVQGTRYRCAAITLMPVFGDWPGQQAGSMWVLLGPEPWAYNRA